MAKDALLGRTGIFLENSAEKQKGHSAYTFAGTEISSRKSTIQWAPAQGNAIRQNRMGGKYLGGKNLQDIGMWL